MLLPSRRTRPATSMISDELSARIAGPGRVALSASDRRSTTRGATSEALASTGTPHDEQYRAAAASSAPHSSHFIDSCTPRPSEPSSTGGS